MISNLKHSLHFVLIALLAIESTTFAQEVIDKDTSRLIRRSEKLANSLVDIQSDESSLIPPTVMRRAKGLIILKQYEAGVIFGAKGGFGVALRRNADHSWSAPAWIKTGEISGGLQLGAQKLNVALVIMNDDGLKMLNKAKFRVGIDARVTRGPTGSNYESNISEDADIFAYNVNEGYYAGATFEGGVLLPDRRANEVSYLHRFEVSEILADDSLEVPAFFDRLLRLLSEIEAGQSARP
ncbi:lipid-binding SYLF domain-containing protein [Pelagicoccus sp. SDUM812002]|uniref:lipid-binding SYLF domain-containing protein n=1 Tax=Pelagicoccus sp. SDUM812002 TaxID=3041266 RepID=UPI0028105AC0|nr:lipid-binding SYLF domain-containing protein [Pelagicoccus sp. SDUM812002]MDQ8185424.1 lipid-binding SYLF domain-containing protein [Pelagicoccus sp. SDUM812002]